jgi:hypothetical protein
MAEWLVGVAIFMLLVAAVWAVMWALGFRRSHEARSRLLLMVTTMYGMEGLSISLGFLSFLAGLGLTDVTLDVFGLQWNYPTWIRLAGGVASLVVYLLALKLLKKVLRSPSAFQKS